MKLRLFHIITSANDHIPRILSYEYFLIFDTRFKSRKMNSVAIKGAAYACFKNGLRIIQIFQFLVTAFGNDCVSLSSVSRWVRQIKAGIFTFEKRSRPGRPKNARSEKNIELIRQKIEADDSITIRALLLATRLSRGTINNIIRYDLGLKKLSARWIPRFLTDDQKRKRVAVAKTIVKDFGPNGQYRVTDIVTGDETYIDLYCRPMKSKDRR